MPDGLLTSKQGYAGMQVMYQLQRGPLLGDVAGHADETALLHTTFLAASTAVALLMMAPALYAYGSNTAAFQQVPAIDLAIQTGVAKHPHDTWHINGQRACYALHW